MITRKTIKTMKEVEEEKITKVTCDFCGYEFDETTTSCNGFGQLGFGFGYGSSFDDDYFHLQICDKCFIEKFGNKLKDQFKLKGFDMNADWVKKVSGGLK